MANKNENGGISHKEFFEKALTAAGEWTRYADPKVIGVAAFLSFGVTDLLSNAEQLYYGLSDNSRLEWLTTVCFLGGCLFAALSVLSITLALFPRLKPKGPRSLYYFGGIAEFNDPNEYEQVVRQQTPQELESHIAGQAWNVAKLAYTKHRWTRLAYVCLLVFLTFWAVARVALSFAS